MFEARSLSDSGLQPVHITKVDTVSRIAEGLTRRMSYVIIDLRYHVGGLQVTPAVGEKWMVSTANSMQARLVSKIPSNAPEMLVEAEPGQVQVGSSGPLELHGSQINARGPLMLALYAAEDRPDATEFLGGVIFDTTLGKPLYSDGAEWCDWST